MTTINKTRRKFTPEQRITLLAERILKLRAGGKKKYARSGELLSKMVALGLKPGQPIAIPGHDVPFELVDNFAGERTGGWATVPKYELAPLTKKKAASAAAAAMQAEVVP